MKNHIEERRKARGMTQQQLASELGVSRQTIISLENGKYNPSILLAHSIARLFGARLLTPVTAASPLAFPIYNSLIQRLYHI